MIHRSSAYELERVGSCMVRLLCALSGVSCGPHSFCMLLLLLALSRHNNTLLFQHLRQCTILVHGHENIATTNELLVDVELRYRRPFRVLLDACRICQLPMLKPLRRMFGFAAESRRLRTCSQVLIFKHIECCELVRVYTLHAQNLYARPRESTLWCLWCSLHEQHDGGGGDCTVDCAADFIGEASNLEGREEARSRGGADRGCTGGGTEGLRTVNLPATENREIQIGNIPEG
jgi:hypothetical protein